MKEERGSEGLESSEDDNRYREYSASEGREERRQTNVSRENHEFCSCYYVYTFNFTLI